MNPPPAQEISNWYQLESIYRTAPFVFNICIHASSTRKRPIATVVVAEHALRMLAVNRLGIDHA
jgi:long-subunit acyl-CoA synthetase (AMP-forming)